MNLKIISDGTATGSRVVDAKTGEQVENVEFVDLHISGKDGVRGTLRFIMLQVDVEFRGPEVMR